MSEDTPKRMTVSRLAEIMAERRSAANAYVNIKGSAQGVAQPDVNITPDTTEADVDRMTEYALKAFARIIDETNGAYALKPSSESQRAARAAAAIAKRQVSK